jgi:cytochrome c-type biogenesis protein
MDIILSASIIAAFLAGMVALFAPCCITVLLPAYLASAFREKKNILKMTLIFFAGITVVLLPIGLGAAWLAEFFRDFHEELYVIGGSFMVILAVMAVFGKGFSVPIKKRVKASANVTDPKSVFGLGILSGAATSCCAPVLAGAVTLAVVSGVFWKALIVVFAYIFGMVFPLFVVAYFYDRFKIDKSRIVRGKLFEVKVRGKNYFIHSTNLIAAFIFLSIGVTMLVLGLSGNAFYSPHTQAELGKSLTVWSAQVGEVLMRIPDVVWGAILVGLFAFFWYRVKKTKEKNNKEKNGNNKPCH